MSGIYVRIEPKHLYGPFASKGDVAEAIIEELQRGGSDIEVGDSAYDIDDLQEVADPTELVKASRAAVKLLYRVGLNRTVDVFILTRVIRRLEAALEKHPK